MLEVKNLSVTYNGNIKALKSININVQKGELVVLIGANGAGKTTLLRALTGLVKVDSGSFANLDLTGLNDKRTLNRFAGKKMTDRLLEAFGTSEVAFDKIRGVEDITYQLYGKKTSTLDRKIEKLRKKYWEYVDVDLIKIKSYKISAYGLAHVPEGRQVFANLTVQENLEMGAYRRHNAIKIKQDLKEVFERFPRLEERRKQKNYK